MNGSMNYIIIQQSSRETFIAVVMQYLEKGWKLQGGVSVDRDYYHQAMVKED